MKTLLNNFLEAYLKRCPKTNKIVGFRKNAKFSRILFPVIGIAAIVWFLIRVVPKPSRIAYPCQRFAAGIGGSFIIYLFGIVTSLSVFQWLKKKVNVPVAMTFILFCTSFGIAT
ncbi:MAG: hypothetical protein MI922_30345, partial [Bacteroidales bacterium]|nr:hypothetical protein [Bacteroidales bacterium]